MKKNVLRIVIGLLLICVILILVKSILGKQSSDVGNKNGEITGKSEIDIDEDTDFSMKFLKLQNNKENLIYSPLSIKYALMMLKEGAEGNTKTQIEDVLGDVSLNNYENIHEVLSFANGVFVRDIYDEYVKKEYKDILTQKYDAEIKTDSFKNAKNINEWIENKTLGIIKNMLRDEIIQNPDNKMVLINALAIDMEWKLPFDSEDTHGEDFYLEDGSSINATTMNLTTRADNASYYKDENITALSMDLKEYEGTELEFVAIMPNDNLSDYIEDFSEEKLNNITDEMTLASETKKGIDISIPRFSFDYDLPLKDNLMNLGIVDAFDDKLADFSNMSKKPIFVGDALHKADIEFTEKGIKAAAVTVIYMTDGILIQEEKPIEVVIDKPFLYVIRDKNTGEIWFIGTVYEPNHWDDDKADYKMY